MIITIFEKLFKITRSNDINDLFLEHLMVVDNYWAVQLIDEI